MKVKFLKDHQGIKEGSVNEVSEDRGNYLILVGVAEKHTQKRKSKPKENKNGKPKTEDK